MINNRYKIKNLLGEGRNRVYLCTDLKNGYDYALKVTNPDLTDEELKSFSDEYHTINKLSHPGIIRAHESGTVVESEFPEIYPGSRYILLEYFNGTELSLHSDFSEDELRRIIIQIASVLQYLHMSGFIYYDLKPENILTDHNSIKLIDFGFTQAHTETAGSVKKGTAEYIAPELIKNEHYDHRIDYYSFGMMLYKLIYGRFPFDSSSGIQIYKAQVESDFEFPENRYSEGINAVLQFLLRKDPGQRCRNSMKIFSLLGYSPSPDIISSWVPSKKFSGRKDVINIIRNYLTKYSGGDIFIIKGSEGAGKTVLLKKFAEMTEDVILLDSVKTLYGTELITELLSKLLNQGSIYRCISPDVREKIKNFLLAPPDNLIGQIKSIFSQAAKECRFVLLIDDFNFLDELSFSVFHEIIPLLQVNNVKVVLTENSDRPSLSGFIHNQHHVNLHPLTESQLQEYIESSFYPDYPGEDLRKLIMMYADLLPGSIDSFIRDLVLSGIIRFTAEGIFIEYDDKTTGILKLFHEQIYQIRYSRLEKDEAETALWLSTFEVIPERRILDHFPGGGSLGTTLISLRNKNIIHLSGNASQVSFASAGMKEFLYSQVEDKSVIHLSNAEVLQGIHPRLKKEIAWQFESAGDYVRSLEYNFSLYHDAEKNDAYSYQRSIIEHVIGFPLEDEIRYKLKFELCKVLHKSGDSSAVLEHVKELMLYISDSGFLNELLILKGMSLISSGNPEEGVRQIESLVEFIPDKMRREQLQIEIASAYLDLNEYAKAESLCRGIISSGESSDESKARCSNLLGLISIHRDNDFESAYVSFHSAEEIYSSAGLKFGTAQMLLNQANIKLMKGDIKEAGQLWQKSLEINSTVGNLKHEATLLLNFGVLYFEKLDYEKSLEYYKRALSIFTYTGDQKGEGLVDVNLAEIYFLSCDYKNALHYINEAKEIFQKLQDTNEELEALFLAGKIFLELGSMSDLRDVLNDFEGLLNIELGEKHSYNYRLLKLALKKDNLNFFHEINDIIKYYRRQGDKVYLFRASIQAVHFLLDHQLSKEALEILNESSLIEASNINDSFNAEWNLYMGLVLAEAGNYDIHPSEYYIKAHNLVENLSISELTWKIMNVMAGFYYRRGNLLKAEEFAYYTKSLLEHISGKIGIDRLRNSYLSRKDVKEAMLLSKNILKRNG